MKGDFPLIVTLIALGITLLYCGLYFAPVLDYLMSEYCMVRQISKTIAKEDLKKAMPDIPDLASSISNILAAIIVALRLFGVSVGYLSGVFSIFLIATVVFCSSCFIKPRGHLKQILRTAVVTVLVFAFLEI